MQTPQASPEHWLATLDDVRAAATSLTAVELRTLDAIHIASALALGDELAGVITNNRRIRGMLGKDTGADVQQHCAR